VTQGESAERDSDFLGENKVKCTYYSLQWMRVVGAEKSFEERGREDNG
jgi:hypothetical protein